MKKLSLGSEILTRGVEDIVTREELKKLLERNRPLRIKHGIDVTAPELHLGHAAALWKLRSLQEAGHKVLLLLGDITTQIGDPTGKSKTRPWLAPATIRKNMRAVLKQATGILLNNPRVLEIHKNSEWYGCMRVPEFLKVLSYVTHARLMERDMFQGRLKKGTSIYIHELIYPVLQGYDSVMLKSDLTVIGSDQLFNEHLGRMLQEKFGQPPQAIVALKILPGLEGGEKMSKSLGNYVGLPDKPKDKFGKIMRLRDQLIIPYLEGYTDVPLAKVESLREGLARGQSPMEAKLFLAEEIVGRYHNRAVAARERRQFLEVFSRGAMPRDISKVRLAHQKWNVVDLLLASHLSPSKSEARRLIQGRAVEVGGRLITDSNSLVEVQKGTVIQVGKRRFLKIL